MNFLRRLFRRAKRPRDNVTPRAQQLLVFARREADRFSHSTVGAEHLLLGMISLGQGVGISALATLGARTDSIRSDVEAGLRHGMELHVHSKISGTEDLMKAMRLASEEAEALGHTYLGTEHILLALFQSENELVRRALSKVANDLAAVRSAIVKVLGFGK